MPQTPGPILRQVGALAVAAAAAVFRDLLLLHGYFWLITSYCVLLFTYFLLPSCYLLLLFTCLMLFCSNSWLPRALHVLFVAFLLSSVAFYMPCAVSQ